MALKLGILKASLRTAGAEQVKDLGLGCVMLSNTVNNPACCPKMP